MSASAPRILDAQGKPLPRLRLRRDENRCPKCGAGPDRRQNTAGFGAPVICCGDCGHHYEGATE
jgi:hypothetical protein